MSRRVRAGEAVTAVRSSSRRVRAGRAVCTLFCPSNSLICPWDTCRTCKAVLRVPRYAETTIAPSIGIRVRTTVLAQDKSRTVGKLASLTLCARSGPGRCLELAWRASRTFSCRTRISSIANTLCAACRGVGVGRAGLASVFRPGAYCCGNGACRTACTLTSAMTRLVLSSLALLTWPVGMSCKTWYARDLARPASTVAAE